MGWIVLCKKCDSLHLNVEAALLLKWNYFIFGKCDSISISVPKNKKRIFNITKWQFWCREEIDWISTRNYKTKQDDEQTLKHGTYSPNLNFKIYFHLKTYLTLYRAESGIAVSRKKWYICAVLSINDCIFINAIRWLNENGSIAQISNPFLKRDG